MKPRTFDVVAFISDTLFTRTGAWEIDGRLVLNYEAWEEEGNLVTTHPRVEAANIKSKFVTRREMERGWDIYGHGTTWEDVLKKLDREEVEE